MQLDPTLAACWPPPAAAAMGFMFAWSSSGRSISLSHTHAGFVARCLGLGNTIHVQQRAVLAGPQLRSTVASEQEASVTPLKLPQLSKLSITSKSHRNIKYSK